MSATSTQVTPEAIFATAQGFMAAKHLFVANEIGLFGSLAPGPATLEALALSTGVPARTVRIVADAMVALGFLERDGDAYRNSDVAAAFLTGNGPFDARPLLRFWNAISYPAWLGLEQAVRTGEGGGPELDGELQTIFSEGVEAFTTPDAHALAEAYDFGSHRRLLDVGGGTGSFLVTILGRHEQLQATLFELPAVAEIARRKLATTPVGGRAAVVTGSAFDDELPVGHDAVLLANVVHYLLPERNVELLRHVRDAVEPGARVLLVDFWTDPTHTSPVPSTLIAGEFLTLVGGDVYSEEEGRDWLGRTGWRPVETLPLAGPASVLVGEAI